MFVFYLSDFFSFKIGLLTFCRLAQLSRWTCSQIIQKVQNVWSTFPEGREQHRQHWNFCDWWKWEWKISGKGTDSISAMRRQACIADWQIARRWWICGSEEEEETAQDSAGRWAKVNNGGKTAKILKRGLQAQRKTAERKNKKRVKFRFSCCGGRPFYGRPSAPKGGKRKGENATVSAVEGASFALLPITPTTLVWLLYKKHQLQRLKSAQFGSESQKSAAVLKDFISLCTAQAVCARSCFWFSWQSTNLTQHYRTCGGFFCFCFFFKHFVHKSYN